MYMSSITGGQRSRDRGARRESDDAPAFLPAGAAHNMINSTSCRTADPFYCQIILTRSAAVLVLLVLVLMALDLLGESGKILRVEGNGEAELWRYVSLRVPLLIQRFLPFSVLLGTLIIFTGLSQHSEVVAMKASGLSAHQIRAFDPRQPRVCGAGVRLQRDRRGQIGADVMRTDNDTSQSRSRASPSNVW